MPMRSTLLGLTTLIALTATGCSNSSTSDSDASAPKDSPSAATQPAAGAASAVSEPPISSARLRTRLLDTGDLGDGYTPKPQEASAHDDVTVIGCPALERLGGDSAAGGRLDFAESATAAFAYTGSATSEVSEDLYSDTEAKLASGTAAVFDAMGSCPSYTLASGSTTVRITTQKAPVAQLGEQQWGHLLMFAVGGRSTIVKQAAVRTGSVLVVLSGSPTLVDTHLAAAVSKASAAR